MLDRIVEVKPPVEGSPPLQGLESYFKKKGLIQKLAVGMRVALSFLTISFLTCCVGVILCFSLSTGKLDDGLSVLVGWWSATRL